MCSSNSRRGEHTARGVRILDRAGHEHPVVQSGPDGTAGPQKLPDQPEVTGLRVGHGKRPLRLLKIARGNGGFVRADPQALGAHAAGKGMVIRRP